MREIQIDLNQLKQTYQIGYTNEGNFTTLSIKLSEELSQADYYVCAFEDVNGNRHPSARLQAIENVVSITLWQELLQSNRLILNVEAYKENADGTVMWKGKSQTINLLVHNATDSDGGVSDEQLNSLIAEIAQLENRLKEIKEEVENGDYKGEKGDKGEQGLPGAQGVPGKDGVDGVNGKDGKVQSVFINDVELDANDNILRFCNDETHSVEYVELHLNYDGTKVELTNKIGNSNDLPAIFLTETNLNSRNSITSYIGRMCAIIELKTALKTDLTKYVTSTNLTNNYYNKTQVNDLISKISTMSMLVVATLPTSNISTTTIYLVPAVSSKTNNVYDEFIYVQSKWEKIGSTDVDLSNYVNYEIFNTTVSQIETALASKASSTDLTNAVNTLNASISTKADSSTLNSYVPKTQIASTTQAGILKVDGTTIAVNTNGVANVKGKLISSYIAKADYIYHPTSVDLATGVFTCADTTGLPSSHVSVWSNKACLSLKKNTFLKPEQEFTGIADFTPISLKAVDNTHFTVATANGEVTNMVTQATSDITKYVFEYGGNLTNNVMFTNLPNSSHLRVRLKSVGSDSFMGLKIYNTDGKEYAPARTSDVSYTDATGGSDYETISLRGNGNPIKGTTGFVEFDIYKGNGYIYVYANYNYITKSGTAYKTKKANQATIVLNQGISKIEVRVGNYGVFGDGTSIELYDMEGM